MQTAQPGDRVEIHYVKRFQDGSVVSSHKRAPVELTIGVDDRRLPGLGLALVGLPAGASTTVHVNVEDAYGPSDPGRIRHWPRSRFPKEQLLPVGKWVEIVSRQGRRRRVRVMELRGSVVVVDTNHRRAGLALDLEVELLRIHARETAPEPRES
jgi:peptidylprolyl isomerase